MKQSSKCALGGITAALSLVMMISVAIVPFMTYALPAIAGALTVFMVVEVDKKWAFGVYAAVAILGMFLVPEKEVAVMYLALFGYYPIVKALIESKVPAVVGWLLKIILFEITMVVSYILMIKFMGVTIDEMDTLGKLAIPILLGAGTLAFIIYDFALTRLVSIYTRNWRKHFRRYFK
ncbi:MAG: hypothetical protein IKY00_02225 [Clostridia bacterium]|nr:hypothetical protein [Clostridia bacterium]